MRNKKLLELIDKLGVEYNQETAKIIIAEIEDLEIEVEELKDEITMLRSAWPCGME